MKKAEGDLTCTQCIYFERGGWGRWWGWGRMKGANDLKYVVFTARWWTVAACSPCVRVRTCESCGMKIYHTVFITVDAIVDSNHVWRGSHDFPRGGDLCDRQKSRTADDQRRVLRSTAVLSAPRRRRRQGWRVTNASYNTCRFTLSNCETRERNACTTLLRVFLCTLFRIVTTSKRF